ncbi:MAG TPA: Crp/Fnr family transcriptional regulator [Chitinophagaceae bacterium]|jgi:CRP-like cAMP-binding protein|nr:Crp/Fnr family transcriptional regulator [Chitinophagaceae bacterium]
MYDALLKYFNSYTTLPVSEGELESIEAVFTPKKFRKRQFFLQEGEVCKYSAFIVKGAMRQFRVDDKGEEHIIRLFIENWWASDRESLIKETPSVYFIDAWEDTEALLVARDALTDLVARTPALSQWLRNLDANFAIASQRRLNAAISLSAEERFRDLEKSYPEFLQRFPQHIIASYLGINSETLSRIRRRGVKK